MLYYYIMTVILHYLLETLHHFNQDLCFSASLYNLLKPLRTVEHKLFIIAQKITIFKQIK